MVDRKVAPSTMVDKKFAPNNGRLVDHLKYNFPSSRSLLLRESPTEMVEQTHPRRYSSRATRWEFSLVGLQLVSDKSDFQMVGLQFRLDSYLNQPSLIFQRIFSDAGVQPQRTIGKSDQEAREAANEGIPVIGDLLSQGWTVSSNRRRCCFGQLTRTITRVNPFQ